MLLFSALHSYHLSTGGKGFQYCYTCISRRLGIWVSQMKFNSHNLYFLSNIIVTSLQCLKRHTLDGWLYEYFSCILHENLSLNYLPCNTIYTKLLSLKFLFYFKWVGCEQIHVLLYGKKQSG